MRESCISLRKSRSQGRGSVRWRIREQLAWEVVAAVAVEGAGVGVAMELVVMG
jgi:hypothetical protein